MLLVYGLVLLALGQEGINNNFEWCQFTFKNDFKISYVFVYT